MQDSKPMDGYQWTDTLMDGWIYCASVHPSNVIHTTKNIKKDFVLPKHSKSFWRKIQDFSRAIVKNLDSKFKIRKKSGSRFAKNLEKQFGY